MKAFLNMSITNRLKEKGFTFALPIRYDGENYYHSVEPQIYQVLDWLRIEKNIDIVVIPIDGSTIYMGGEKYLFLIYKDGQRNFNTIRGNYTKCVKWEDAAVAGIEYVIDNLL